MKQISLPSKYVWYITAIVVIISSLFIAYRPSLSYEFQFDDLANITKHFNIRHYTFGHLFFSGTRWISYWINSFLYVLGGFDPFVYRVFSVCIHAINSILVFIFFMHALPRTSVQKNIFFVRHAPLLALSTALLFALHPVSTQTVSYVIQSQLEGLTLTAALLMSILFIIRARLTSVVLYIFITVAIWALGFFSTGIKEIAIVIPFLLLLVDWFFVSLGSWNLFKKNKGFHALLITMVWGTYIYFLKPLFFIKAFGLQMESYNNSGNIITSTPGQLITPLYYCISQFKVIIHYIWIFLWPCNISVEYDWKLVESWTSFDCIIPFLMLFSIAVAIAVLVYKNKTSPIAFGLLWFFVALAPRSTIIPSPELLVDYKTYIGSWGLLFVILSAVVFLLEKLSLITSSAFIRKNGKYILPLVIVSAGIPLTIMRNKVWSSGTEFWMNIIKNAPGKARAYNNYGVEISQKHNQYKESIPYFQKAIAIDPIYHDPYNNLAVAYSVLGDMPGAICAMKQGLMIFPYYPEGYNNLASFYMHQKQYEEAEAMLNTALALRPYYGKAHYNLGRLYLVKGDQEKAWLSFKTCCTQADLDNELGFESYGQASFLCKKYDDACSAYTQLLALKPGNADVLFGLGNSYYLQKKYDQARDIYQKAISLHPQDFRFWYNMGESYFAEQQFVAAIEWFEKVVTFGQQKPANAFVRLAVCYESLGKPRESYQFLEKLLTIELPEIDKQNISLTMQSMKQRYPTI